MASIDKNNNDRMIPLNVLLAVISMAIYILYTIATDMYMTAFAMISTMIIAMWAIVSGFKAKAFDELDKKNLKKVQSNKKAFNISTFFGIILAAFGLCIRIIGDPRGLLSKMIAVLCVIFFILTAITVGLLMKLHEDAKDKGSVKNLSHI